MNWRKLRPSWKAGWSAIRKSLLKSRSEKNRRPEESEPPRRRRSVKRDPDQHDQRGSAAAQRGQASPRQQQERRRRSLSPAQGCARQRVTLGNRLFQGGALGWNLRTPPSFWRLLSITKHRAILIL